MKKSVVFMSAILMALSAESTVFDTRDQFSITLPDGWVEIPGFILDNYSLALSDATSNETVQVYDYGYQATLKEEWLTYPCVLVQVQNVGRISSGELARYVQQSAGDEADLADGNTLFLDVREQNGIKVLVGVQLTERGLIQLSGFASAETFEEYESLFREAFSSLTIDETIAYKPQLTDDAPVVRGINLGKVFILVIQAAVIGGILWGLKILIVRGIKNRKPAE